MHYGVIMMLLLNLALVNARVCTTNVHKEPVRHLITVVAVVVAAQPQLAIASEKESCACRDAQTSAPQVLIVLTGFAQLQQALLLLLLQ